MIKSRPVTSIAAQNRVGHTGPPARRPPDALPTDRPTPHRGPVGRPPVGQGSRYSRCHKNNKCDVHIIIIMNNNNNNTYKI